MSQKQHRRTMYGLDAPGFVWTCLFGGSALFTLGLILMIKRIHILLTVIGAIVCYNGLWMVPTALLMFRSSFVGKFRERDRLLDGLQLKGDETVLDVGCGHGLLLIGAAQRLPHGRAVGLDLWSQVDQQSNSKVATLINAAEEGVAERIEVHDGDMRAMPFASDTFDAVVASLSIHNIYNREERRKAIYEIVRVLKPGGKAALLDFRHIGQYAADLQLLGMRDVQISKRSFQMYPPVQTVTATKAE